jgi:hypothetical protein
MLEMLCQKYSRGLLLSAAFTATATATTIKIAEIIQITEQHTETKNNFIIYLRNIFILFKLLRERTQCTKFKTFKHHILIGSELYI